MQKKEGGLNNQVSAGEGGGATAKASQEKRGRRKTTVGRRNEKRGVQGGSSPLP